MPIPKQEPQVASVPAATLQNSRSIVNPEVKKTKKSEPSKKIDLGAAANYKGDTNAVSQSIAAPVPKSSDLLEDLFSLSPVPAASPTNPISDLGDNFAVLPQFLPPHSDEPILAASTQFADFESAFTSETIQTVQPTIQPVPSFSEDFVSSNPFASIPSMNPAAPALNPVSSTPINLMNELSTILQPSSGTLVPNNISIANNNVSAGAKKELANTTWGSLGLNIDLDNLLTRDTKTSAPSMNQLAADVGRITLNQSQQVLQPRTLSPSFGGELSNELKTYSTSSEGSGRPTQSNVSNNLSSHTSNPWRNSTEFGF